jgi:magnesium transporter
MANHKRRRSQKAGLPPGSLIHIGEQKVDRPRVKVFSYGPDDCEEKELTSAPECAAYRSRPGVVWINVDGIHDAGLLTSFGECLGLHPLTMEDIQNTEQRPKLEDYGTYLYVVLRTLSHGGDGSGEVKAEQVSFILSKGCVLSFQERVGDCFDPIRERIRGAKGRVRGMGPDYLLYRLMDAVVDNYFVVIEEIGERFELLEEKVLAKPDPATLAEIHSLKRQLVLLRRSLWPLRETVSSLERSDSPLIDQGVRVFLRDIYDHTVQVIDLVESYRDTLSGMLDVYLSSVSNRMNEVMRVLTVIATIFMPLTFIAGIYGMNFEHMPELSLTWGYPAVWIVMVATFLGMLVYFRRKGWL